MFCSPQFLKVATLALAFFSVSPPSVPANERETEQVYRFDPAAMPSEGEFLMLPIFLAGREGSDLNALLKSTSQLHNRYRQKDPALEAVRYLTEAIERMTGRKVRIQSVDYGKSAFSLGVLAEAPAEMRALPGVNAALNKNGLYDGNEAFYIRSTPESIAMLANTPDGLVHAVVELLESVDYEVLGMGPNWTHVPDYRTRPLEFSWSGSGRPRFLMRILGPASGQAHGLGTLVTPKLNDPKDEDVAASYNRWAIGTRTVGMSMPPFPGHRMQAYHKQVAEESAARGSDEGFLVAPGSRLHEEGGKYFNAEEPKRSLKLDVSVPFVREILLEDFKKQSEAYFAKRDETEIVRGGIFIFGTDPEDGLLQEDIDHARYPNWFPDYLASIGKPLGAPYQLHGFAGIDQPHESWTPHWMSDTAYALNQWLLIEYDRWIASQPEAEQVTKEGTRKSDLVRVSLYSYNYHDVPPGFNLDPRNRTMIAGYPKHRGRGKWRSIISHADMARAFRKMISNEPSGDYWIMSIAYYRDYDLSGIGGSRDAHTAHRAVSSRYAAGFRAIISEADFNFGKMGLEYYLYAKMLWNPQQTPEELTALRDRWLRRSFGSGWETMKRYYDLMVPGSNYINSPNRWAKAINLINEADAKISRTAEPDAATRLDELKQYWYFYYLRDTQQDSADHPAMKEFFWKGQTSYMVPMHMVAQRIFKNPRVIPSVGKPLSDGPAHYTAAETAAWWAKVNAHWKWTPVQDFAAAKLADGTSAKEVDLYDLTAIQEFQRPPADRTTAAFHYNSAEQANLGFLSIATRRGEEVGFRMRWPHSETDPRNGPRNVPFGVRRWLADEQRWDDLVDESMVRVASIQITGGDRKEYQLAEGRFTVPVPGTYSLFVGHGGNAALAGGLGTRFPGDRQAFEERGFTLSEQPRGIGQRRAFFYIPKGTESFDLEVIGNDPHRKLTFHHSLPSKGMKLTREINLSTPGTHTIALEKGEDGSLVTLEGNSIAMPHCYSIPQLFAFSPEALLVPRKIAKADGLTPIEDR